MKFCSFPQKKIKIDCRVLAAKFVSKPFREIDKKRNVWMDGYGVGILLALQFKCIFVAVNIDHTLSRTICKSERK